MAAIDEMPTSRLANASTDESVKAILNEMFWSWYTVNQNRKITTVKVWFFSKAVYVRDLKSVFELLVGPNPRY